MAPPPPPPPPAHKPKVDKTDDQILSERVLVDVISPEGTLLVDREGRQTAGMFRRGDYFYLEVLTTGGTRVKIKFNEASLSDHRDRVSRMLLQGV